MSALKNETHNLTQNYNRLNTDFKMAERNVALLTADKTTLQQQAGRVEGLERELHQAKWQVTNLEQQLQSQVADLNFRLTQAQSQAQQAHAQVQQVQAQAQAQVQQVHAQAQAQAQQAQSRALSMPLPMPMSMPPPQPMPTYSPAYVPPPPPVRNNPPAQQYGGYQLAPSYNSNYNNSAPSLSALAASTGFNAASSYSAPYGGYPGSSSSSSGNPNSAHKRAASNPVVDSTASAPFGTAGKSPFANEVTSAQINHVFDDLDRRLTSMMTEKTTLQDESERYIRSICLLCSSIFSSLSPSPPF